MAAVGFKGHHQAIRLFWTFYLFYFARNNDSLGGWEHPVLHSLFDPEAEGGEVVRLLHLFEDASRLEGELRFRERDCPHGEAAQDLTVRIYLLGAKKPYATGTFTFTTYTGKLTHYQIFPQPQY